MAQPKKIDLMLGTAMWGWTVAERTCFELLDEYYQLGGRVVDSATNYPINKKPEDFRRAEKILAQWWRQSGVTDLEISMKVGSINNMRSPKQNLSPSFLRICVDTYQQLFGEQLKCLMIHWDNRKEEKAITESLDTFADFQNKGLQLGLSGIRFPEVYAKLLAQYDFGKCPLQLKHNLLYSDYQRYLPLQERASFIAYGINAGGLKLNRNGYGPDASLIARGGVASSYTPMLDALDKHMLKYEASAPELEPPKSMNHLGLLFAAYHPGITGILLGTSDREQLKDSFNWVAHLKTYDYTPYYADLMNIYLDAQQNTET